MIINMSDRSVDFHPWRPADSQVFHEAFAVDTETTRIDDYRPWLTPAYVLAPPATVSVVFSSPVTVSVRSCELIGAPPSSSTTRRLTWRSYIKSCPGWTSTAASRLAGSGTRSYCTDSTSLAARVTLPRER